MFWKNRTSITGPLRIYAALAETEILKVMKEKLPKNRKGKNYLSKAAFREAHQNTPLHEDKARQNLKPPWQCWHVLFKFLWRLLAICRICIINFFVIKWKVWLCVLEEKVQTKGGNCNGKRRICMFREGRNLLLHKAACFSVRKRSMGSMGGSSFGMC